MTTVDLCVIGGGPAGCFAAFHVARHGFQPVVLEEHPAIGEPVDCSGIIGVEAFEALDLPGASVVGAFRDLDLVAPGGARLRFTPRGTLAHVVDRAAFDRSLAHLAREANATILTSATVSHVEPTAQSVTVRFTQHGSPRQLSARAVLLANGPRYRFQEALGMGRPAQYLRTMQTEVVSATAEIPKVYVGQRVASGSFAWFLPLQSGSTQRIKIGISTTTGENDVCFHAFLSVLRAQGLLPPSGTPQPRGWMIPITPIPRTFANRVLAVGDAAGQTKPTTGGGLYYGLLCAKIAAETLAEAFHRDALMAHHLADYEVRWKHRLGKELRTALMFRKLIEQLSDQELDCLFQLARHDSFLRFLERRANFDWHRDLILHVSRKPRFAVALLQGMLRSWLPV